LPGPVRVTQLPSIFWSARLSASRRRSRCRIIQTATISEEPAYGSGPVGSAVPVEASPGD